MAKTKRVVNSSFLIVLSLSLILIISIFKIPSFLTTRSLENLGFSASSIKSIKHLKLSKLIIDNEYYSDYLNNEISKEDFKKEYLELYLYRKELKEDDFLLYDKLITKGYSKDEILKLYQDLKFYELTPLLVFDKLDNLDTYINDCKKHTNTIDSFILSNDYLKPFKDAKSALNIGETKVLVTPKYTLNQYTPEKLVPLASMYASEGVELENETYGAFINLWQEMYDKNLAVYALRGYRSYDDQKNVYDSLINSDTDAFIIAPGMAESQTGLAIMIVDSKTERINNFENTDEYLFLKEHAHEYGFIIRYPDNKTSITGYPFIPYQLRYLGKELATKVYNSKLTFEEYYMLYINE